MSRPLRLLHAIHDFLPRHRAGSEIYAFELCRELDPRHHVTVLCAEFDPGRPHGHVAWRQHEGLAVVEIVNNWACASFEETYRPPLVERRIGDVLRSVQPEVVHVHNLLNLSFALPGLARQQGAAVVATLHDYTLECPSGGQRVHRAAAHRCDVIDTERCARCFPESPFHAQASFAKLTAAARAPGLVRGAAAAAVRRLPRLAGAVAGAVRRAAPLPLTARDIEARLAAARDVFDQVDLFVAPSPSIANEFEKLGIDRSRLRISDYGFVPLRRRSPASAPAARDRLRIGFVGTLVWHKGVHVLIEAAALLPRDAYELEIFGSLEVFPDYAAGLRAQARGLPVRFMGPFDRERAADAYAGIDVLVVPSLWLENSPLVIHEAFMAGVPVVASRIGGIADLVEDGRTGLLVEPGSAAALAAALRSLIDSPERVGALSRRLPAVKSMAEDACEWEGIYADVLSRRGDPAEAV